MKIEQTREILEKIKIANSVNARPIITNKELQESLNTAIKSLDMWDKVVELINTKYGYILKATKYGNKDAEQQAFSYSNVLMYEVAAIIEDILDDFEEYKPEEKEK